MILTLLLSSILKKYGDKSVALQHWQPAEKVILSGCSKMPRCKALKIPCRERFQTVPYGIRRNDEG